jgi:hypothetical protein
MANNRKITRGRNHKNNYTQVVMSAPSRLFVEKYLTKKGTLLLASAKTKADKTKVWDKYGKNRYRNNPDSHPIPILNGIKRIIHT